MTESVWMGYRTVQRDEGAVPWPHIAPLLTSSTTVGAWLENPCDPNGFKLDDAAPLANGVSLILAWKKGRLFGEMGDLQWDTMPDGTLHLVLLAHAAKDDLKRVCVSETTAAPDDAPSRDPVIGPLEPVGDEYAILLWGERRPDESGGGRWQEARIPELHRWYPAHWQGPQAALRVRDYEVEWQYGAEADAADLPTCRVVTRYLMFQGTYTLPQPDLSLEL